MLRLPERPRSCPGAEATGRWPALRPALALLVLVVVVVASGTLAAEVTGATAVRTGVVAASVQSDGATTTVAPAAGDGAKTTTEAEGTAADDPAQDRLRIIIIGLVVLAVVVLFVTVLFWRATSPRRVVTVSEVAADDRDDDLDEDVGEDENLVGQPVDLSEIAFAAALMAPSSPLPSVDHPPTRSVAPTETAPPSPGPAVVKPDPVDWPEAEPERLDLRGAQAEPEPELPDPPRFESTAEQPAIDLPEPEPGPADWTEWRGIRPLGPVERSAGRDDT